MSLKSLAAKWYAGSVYRRIRLWDTNAPELQSAELRRLTSKAAGTAFGKEHGFSSIQSHEDFKKSVPVRDYEGLKSWFDQVAAGKKDILWPGKPEYLCKTSGTTSGTKFIPMGREGIRAQIAAAKYTLLCYIARTGKTDFVNGKMIFLQGSPDLTEKNGIKTGRLSGIVAHHVPSYLQRNRMPTLATNRIEDWEKKVDAIVEETISRNMTLISGIPPWVQMYFEKLIKRSGKKTITEVFPHFSLFVHGGVNFEPYRQVIKNLIGREIDTLETYPASEGFIAFQDDVFNPGLLLNMDAGIFYEFVPAGEVGKENPTRLGLAEVETGVNYAIVLNTSSGLWGYLIGDTVKFISLAPYKIVVTGRIKHFISAFGEHVIAEEVEKAITEVAEKFKVAIEEFHVAPQVSPEKGELPFHEWFIETEGGLPPQFGIELDNAMRKLNSYYDDLIGGNVLQRLRVTTLPKRSFNRYMASQGKLGGQNKLPRLANDRSIADALK